MSSVTPRFAMPNILVSQAHKEITHNEALVMIDILLHASVEQSASAPPSLDEADAGKCWLIAAPATGAWAGRENSIAGWNGSSWRFVEPIAGMRVWHKQYDVECRYSASGWSLPASIAAPSGGTVEDVEARAALTAMFALLRSAGILAR